MSKHPRPCRKRVVVAFGAFYDVKQEHFSVSSRRPAQSWVCRRLGRRMVCQVVGHDRLDVHAGAVACQVTGIGDRRNPMSHVDEQDQDGNCQVNIW